MPDFFHFLSLPLASAISYRRCFFFALQAYMSICLSVFLLVCFLLPVKCLWNVCPLVLRVLSSTQIGNQQLNRFTGLSSCLFVFPLVYLLVCPSVLADILFGFAQDYNIIMHIYIYFYIYIHIRIHIIWLRDESIWRDRPAVGIIRAVVCIDVTTLHWPNGRSTYDPEPPPIAPFVSHMEQTRWRRLGQWRRWRRWRSL